jgi:thiamine biosynthesis lipoprotein
VETALEAARRTDGAVDPTVGSHVAAWGYDADIVAVRSAAPGRRTTDLPRADWRRVVADSGLGLVGVARGLRLDLGATAKAWTADEAAARLERALEVPALVALGGDVAVSGDAGWPVLVSEREGGAGEVVTVRRGGLATSSTRVRRWQTPDGEAHHIIDPGTGRPTTGAARTASVLAASCLAANALSTAALVWGADARERLQSHAARLVDADGRVVRTDGWPSDRPAGGAAA